MENNIRSVLNYIQLYGTWPSSGGNPYVESTNGILPPDILPTVLHHMISKGLIIIAHGYLQITGKGVQHLLLPCPVHTSTKNGIPITIAEYHNPSSHLLTRRIFRRTFLKRVPIAPICTPMLPQLICAPVQPFQPPVYVPFHPPVMPGYIRSQKELSSTAPPYFPQKELSCTAPPQKELSSTAPPYFPQKELSCTAPPYFPQEVTPQEVTVPEVMRFTASEELCTAVQLTTMCGEYIFEYQDLMQSISEGRGTDTCDNVRVDKLCAAGFLEYTILGKWQITKYGKQALIFLKEVDTR